MSSVVNVTVLLFFLPVPSLVDPWELHNWQWEYLVHFIPNSKLKAIQIKADKEPHNVKLMIKEAKTIKEYNTVVQDEEKFLYQQAKIEWLSDGDKNSRFFHVVLKGKNHRNIIDMVYDEKGERFKGSDVAEQFVKHFQSFLETAYHVEALPPNSLTVTKVTERDADNMVRPILDTKVKEDLFDISDNKAPGPDGYNSKFYKQAWNIGGKDVCGAVKEFFQKGKLHGEVNDTLITLVPKMNTHMKVSDYRPIASAFSVCVNGERHGYFKGGRGLRQGDPISPYMFTLVMEVFTQSMKKQISVSRCFKYHWGCKELEISHLCFVDDLLVLCHGDILFFKVVKKALESFNAVSGLVPNLGKSTIFFGNVEESIENEILEIMPFKIGKLPVSYLGVPLITKQIGINECKCLIDKVNNWKNRMLSYAGRLQLVASVLTSMQVYRASVFILPKTVIKDIDKLFKGFLWCQASNKESLWVKWINVIRLKWKCIWEAKNNTNSSSGWKKLLSLRDKIKKHVKCEVGNSKTIFLWHGKCIPVPTLRDKDDKTYWMTKDGKKVKWSIHKMWDDWK
uniref:RNA-directed DNA polymerase, eukaryota, reverse transcriptase zinc-binding domain protein n=1 Tax=Tanacetum cinerariifolium TaxID=118510 RepID=A0A699I605_TANCI|nr:RNA-directed DNA polymerase, eukaryota, reverse transcriptase zinc-binding domain protein [Tanacetum cinerariifolium]